MQLNPSKPLAGIFATLAFLYGVYTMLDGTPLGRAEKVCAPVFVWPKRMVVGATDIFSPVYSQKVAEKFDNGDAKCKAWVWNAFYRDRYTQVKEQVQELEGGR
jgi:hypothetical protein